MRQLLSVILFASALSAQTSPYPGALDTNSTLGVAANRVSTKLSVGISASATSIQVDSATRIVANVILAIDASSTSPEYVWVCSVSGNTLTLGKTACPNADGRGADGSTAAIHASGAAVAAYPNAWNFNALAAGLKATQGALGANLSAIAAGPFTNSAAYNFTPQSPGGSLVIGANVVTMTPCPFGVAGSHTVVGGLPHLLYISGGVGTAEAVPIAGGTCTSGLTTGTLIISAANTHSGAWTIKSNTTGVQEAVYVAGVNGVGGILGSVRMPAGPIDLWATTSTVAALNVPTGYGVSLRGQGRSSTFLRTHATTGNWISYIGNGYADMGDFFIVDDGATLHTLGAMITITNVISGSIDNIHAEKCYDCLVLLGVNGNTHFTRLNVYGAHIGFWVNGSAYSNQFSLTDSTLHGDQNGIRIDNTTTVGVYIANNLVDQVNLYGLALSTGAAISISETTNLLPTNEIALTGNDFEAVGTAIELIGSNTAFQNNAVTVTGGRINSTYCGVCAYSGFNGLKVDSAPIGLSNGTSPVTVAIAGIRLQGVTNFTIQNNTISLGTGAALPVGITFAATGNNVGKISGNVIGKEGTAPVLGILVAGADSIQVEHNVINSSGAALSTSGTVTNLAASGNIGVDNVIPAVASAATLAFPLNPNFTLSGSTNVTAVTFSLIAGSYGIVTATAATLTFTAGASIGDNFILKQNTPATWYWDGTKVWLSGQDPALSRSANYIATESGANNAIIGDLTGVPTIAGVTITIKLAHTLQAGANTFNFNSGGAVNIKSSRNTANNIGTAYAATGIVTLTYDGAVWLDVSQ